MRYVCMYNTYEHEEVYSVVEKRELGCESMRAEDSLNLFHRERSCFTGVHIYFGTDQNVMSPRYVRRAWKLSSTRVLLLVVPLFITS